MQQLELGIGPMSSEIIEAVFRYSHLRRKPLMLIPSKNQIDHNGGYVNNWTTKQFMDFIQKMRTMYPQSKVKICRDHCGPGFNGNFDLEDTFNSIKSDVQHGFDLIHIDFCHFQGSKEERFEASRKAVELCLQLNPNIELEIGTDENEGTKFSLVNLQELEEEIDFFKSFCNPTFYVVQTGSLVKEINQVGSFNQHFIRKVHDLLTAKGLKLKEHNADYLSKEEIGLRQGIVDAVNIAPQLGAVQTMLVIKKCLVYGIDFQKFIEDVYQGGKWKKWLYANSQDNKFLCACIAGHYRFSQEPYQRIIEQLEQREDIHETIINEIMEVIGHYDS
ncbi:class II fructose-bisphosphate aldolase [Candidatus Woesearchaeota archaeon]|nr:class II fructose-bisphosphate aldolase [Candidatus Woesearchaeota archaeon]